MPTSRSRADSLSAPEPPPQSRSSVQHGHVVLPSKEDFERASAYYRNHVANHPPSVLPPPLFFDARLGLPQELRPWDPEKGALAGDGPGWGHEEAAVAAAASGSSVAGAAEEPLLSDNVPMLWPPDVEDVPLPTTFKRMRTEDSEKTVWDPLELHRWHDKRQKVESSAVAGKESPAEATQRSAEVFPQEI